MLEVGDLRLDPATQQVWRGEEEIALSAKEFTLLETFMRRPGEVLSQYQLLEHAWDYDYENRSNVVEVYVRYLREKIDRPFGVKSLETVRGAGYRLRKDGGSSEPAADPRRLTAAFALAMVLVLVAPRRCSSTCASAPTWPRRSTTALALALGRRRRCSSVAPATSLARVVGGSGSPSPEEELRPDPHARRAAAWTAPSRCASRRSAPTRRGGHRAAPRSLERDVAGRRRDGADARAPGRGTRDARSSWSPASSLEDRDETLSSLARRPS